MVQKVTAKQLDTIANKAFQEAELLKQSVIETLEGFSAEDTTAIAEWFDRVNQRWLSVVNQAKMGVKK